MSDAERPHAHRSAGLLRALSVVTGAVDLSSASMLLVLASGLGVVAPPLLGGFTTALVVGVAGAVTLGGARIVVGTGWGAPLTMAVARVVVIVAQSLVLLSQTRVTSVVVAAIVSLVLSALVLAAVGVRVWFVRREGPGSTDTPGGIW